MLPEYASILILLLLSVFVTMTPSGFAQTSSDRVCHTDSDCQSYQFCNGSNQCQRKLSDFQSCSANRECSSDLCTNGICVSQIPKCPGTQVFQNGTCWECSPAGCYRVPEFDSLAGIVIIISIVGVITISRKFRF